MILTCPSCTMRYVVAEGAIGPEGRKVRCAHCGHQWFQEGEVGLDEELFGPSSDELMPDEEVEADFEDQDDNDQPAEAEEEADDDDAFQSILQKEIDADEMDIPQGVRPVYHEELIIPLKVEKRVKFPPMERLVGFGTAALVWIFILATLLMCQAQISRAWPPSNMIYTLMGMKPSQPGEGLALDNLIARLDNGKIVMTGDINNLKEIDANVPAVMAEIVDDKNAVLDRVLIAPPARSVPKESKVSFDVTYPSLPKNAKSVNFAFSFLKAPVAAKAAEKPSDEKPAEIKPPVEPKASH